MQRNGALCLPLRVKRNILKTRKFNICPEIVHLFTIRLKQPNEFATSVRRSGNFLARYYFRSEFPDSLLFLSSLFALLSFVFCSRFFLFSFVLNNYRYIISFRITTIRFVKTRRTLETNHSAIFFTIVVPFLMLLVPPTHYLSLHYPSFSSL